MYHKLTFVLKTEEGGEKAAELGKEIAEVVRQHHLLPGEEISFVREQLLDPRYWSNSGDITTHEINKHIRP